MARETGPVSRYSQLVGGSQLRWPGYRAPMPTCGHCAASLRMYLRYLVRTSAWTYVLSNYDRFKC